MNLLAARQLVSAMLTRVRMVNPRAEDRAYDALSGALTAAAEYLSTLEAEKAQARTVAEPPKHSCIACPVQVRDFYAVAYNAVVALQAAESDGSAWPRAGRKVAELEEAVNRFAQIVDIHFGKH